MNDKEYEEHAVRFLLNEGKYIEKPVVIDFESAALQYVKANSDFMYKDHVDAGVLVSKLEEAGYLEFNKRLENKRYHTITEKGISFISEMMK